MVVVGTPEGAIAVGIKEDWEDVFDGKTEEVVETLG